MDKLAFLWGEIYEGGQIAGRLFYILEEVSWLLDLVNLLKASEGCSKSTELKIMNVDLAPSTYPSETHGTSCLMIEGTLPDDEQIRRWLGWPFPSVPVTRQNGMTWERLDESRQVPFQSLALTLETYNTYLIEKYKASNRPRLSERALPVRASIQPSGLVYYFPQKGTQSWLATKPLLWERLLELLKPYQKIKLPKRQTVLIRSNPGLKGALHDG